MTTLESLQPHEVLRFFDILSKHPARLREREAGCRLGGELREGARADAFQDDLHCVVVRKPGQGGLENAPTAHPARAPRHGVRQGRRGRDRLPDQSRSTWSSTVTSSRADGTSLGADNGIGVSYILALLDSKDLPHPPLEAVLTAMEEKGKVGAGQFDTSVLTGTRMIDFNWITDNEILAGCSGDVTFHVDIPGEYERCRTLSATRS